MKIIVGFTLFLLLSVNIFAQNNIISEYVNTCINLLGQPLPANGFERLNRAAFRKIDDDIIVLLENNQIVFTTVGIVAERSHEVAQINSRFYNYFEDNDWEFYDFINGFDIYYKNGIYAGISQVTRRDDGYMVSMIGFSKNINYIQYFY